MENNENIINQTDFYKDTIYSTFNGFKPSLKQTFYMLLYKISHIKLLFIWLFSGLFIRYSGNLIFVLWQILFNFFVYIILRFVIFFLIILFFPISILIVWLVLLKIYKSGCKYKAKSNEKLNSLL